MKAVASLVQIQPSPFDNDICRSSSTRQSGTLVRCGLQVQLLSSAWQRHFGDACSKGKRLFLARRVLSVRFRPSPFGSPGGTFFVARSAKSSPVLQCRVRVRFRPSPSVRDSFSGRTSALNQLAGCLPDAQAHDAGSSPASRLREQPSK